MKNEYFQNYVIDLRILGDIGSVYLSLPAEITEAWYSQQQYRSLITAGFGLRLDYNVN